MDAGQHSGLSQRRRDVTTGDAEALNPVRQVLRSWRCPVYEARNKVCGAGGARRNRRFQLDEIRRLRELTGGHGLDARVLVVTPTFKRPDGVVRAVRSALAQTFDDLAVVVVDDGAGLPADLPDDPRLLAVSLSRNSATLGLVRNVGVALAHSEFIGFLDDDNEWTPDHVATAVSALEDDRALAAVYTSVQRLRPDGSELDVLGEPFDRKKLRQDPYVDANSIVVRRSWNCGFSVLPRNRDTLPKEDWEYIRRLSARGHVAHVPTTTVRYAVNPDSYFTSWDGQQLERH